MKETFIATSGHKYVDIDAYACICAYKELLQLEKHNVEAVISSTLNFSITQKYKEISYFSTDIHTVQEMDNMRYVIMDVSDPAHFEEFVDLDQVSYIFDHHYGFEEYWREKIGDNAVIEPLGAAATLIVREYKKRELLDQISSESAELLAAAIISNSLYFQAEITKEEDHTAYEELQQYFKYTDDFAQKYFLEVQQSVEKDIMTALRDDGKSISEDLYISQLEVWDADHTITNLLDDILNHLKEQDEKDAFINIIDLGKNRNVIQCRDEKTLVWMQSIFPEWEYDTSRNQAITDHVILRKEMLPRLINSN